MSQTQKLPHVTHTLFTPFTHYIACEQAPLFKWAERASRANGKAARFLASSFACLSLVYFSRYLPDEERARRLHITFLDTDFTITWYAKFLDVFVWYIFSINHVEKANEAIAVETLLVTDELFRWEKHYVAF